MIINDNNFLVIKLLKNVSRRHSLSHDSPNEKFTGQSNPRSRVSVDHLIESFRSNIREKNVDALKKILEEFLTVKNLFTFITLKKFEIF